MEDNTAESVVSFIGKCLAFILVLAVGSIITLFETWYSKLLLIFIGLVIYLFILNKVDKKEEEYDIRNKKRR